MISNFYILGSQSKRPPSNRTIFTDGSPDSTFREGIDMELSHWIPNQTPHEYKADTSTEACMKFIERNSAENWDLAINNHLDVDGILSVFTLVHSKFALQHKKTIVEAAEMGDFWAWGDTPSQFLFQGLTLYFKELRKIKIDIREIYERCFEKTFSLLEKKTKDEPSINFGLKALEGSTLRIKDGLIERKVYHNRFVHYNITHSLADKDLSKVLMVPDFNAELSDNVLLLPQARNQYDKEKVQLVSVETYNEGWYYDLWYPGYMWADTPNSGRAPGFTFSGSTNGYYYGYEPLDEVVKQFNNDETSKGTWILVKELSPFSSIQGRNYPIILSFLDNNQKPIPSRLPPEEVTALLSSAFSV